MLVDGEFMQPTVQASFLHMQSLIVMTLLKTILNIVIILEKKKNLQVF